MKSIIKGKGNRCPKCDRVMERREHKEIKFKKAKGYFIEWDYCIDCKHVQHYQEFRRLYE